MNDVFGHKNLQTTKPEIGDEMNFGMSHAPGAGSITRPVDLQSTSVLRLPLLVLRLQ